MPIDVRIQETKDKCRSNWSRVIFSACITIILGSFTVVYTIQQNDIARLYREREFAEAQTIRMQKVYDEYIHDVSDRLLAPRAKSRDIDDKWEQFKQHVRMKTLNALPQVDANQRKKIILFLYENQLLRSDCGWNLVDLSTANLSELQFHPPCNLHYLYLPRVFADRIEFNGCILVSSNFSESQMVGAKFVNTRMGNSKFVGTNLTNALFPQTNCAGLDLTNAILVRSRFGKPPQRMNLHNTDLLDNDWTNEKIVNHTFNAQTNKVLNTRFPDGTFSVIDSKQLVKEGGAEERCGRKLDPAVPNVVSPEWRQDRLYASVFLVNGTGASDLPLADEGQCYFRCPLNKSEVDQGIDVHKYSLLIDSGQAWFNLSALFNCPFHVGQVYVEIGFWTDALLLADESKRPEKMYFSSTARHNETVFQPERHHDLIPKNTRNIYIGVGADQAASEQDQSLHCLVDNIQLKIYKK